MVLHKMYDLPADLCGDLREHPEWKVIAITEWDAPKHLRNDEWQGLDHCIRLYYEDNSK